MYKHVILNLNLKTARAGYEIEKQFCGVYKKTQPYTLYL